MTTRARRRRIRRRIVGAVSAVAILIVVGFVATYGWYRTQLQAADGAHTEVVLVVPKGASTGDIASLLAGAKVVRNARAFRFYVGSSHAGPFEAGRYRFRRHSSVQDAVGVLTAGPLGPEITNVSIPEGFRLGQITYRLHASEPRFSIDAAKKALSSGRIRSPLLPSGSTNFEGLLFPATYAVTPSQPLDAVLQKMADTMTERVDALTIDPDVVRLGLSPYQVVIVASLVQAEAGNPDEAAKIARVIYNRLAAGQPLGIDATSRYLAIITATPVDFESSSPYNTRRQRGLPPTPIGAPGDFALAAAAHPAVGNWLYYVRDVHDDPQGRPQHVFTNSPEEFAKAKQACHDAGLGCGPG